MCPRGTTCIVQRPRTQRWLTTLTVSYFYGKGFSDEWRYTGLTDQARMLSCYHALQFAKYVCGHGAQYCTRLAQRAHDYLVATWAVRSLYAERGHLADGPRGATVAVPVPTLSGDRSEADAAYLQTLVARRGVLVDVLCVRLRGGVRSLVVRFTCHVYHELLDVQQLALAVLEATVEMA
jgi:hypothetical protein